MASELHDADASSPQTGAQTQGAMTESGKMQQIIKVRQVTETTGGVQPQPEEAQLKKNAKNHEASRVVQQAVPIPMGERTFTCFPDLAVELRLKIWKAALPGPRIIQIACGYQRAEELDSVDFESAKISVNAPPPKILAVSKEARNEALKFYKLRLSTKFFVSPNRIDPSVDIVYIPYRDDYLRFYDMVLDENVFEDEVLNSLRFLAMDIDFAEMVMSHVEFYSAGQDHLFLDRLAKFKSLETLTIVLHQKDTCNDMWTWRHKDVDFVDPDMDILTDRGSPAFAEDIQNAFKDAPTRHPEWTVPKIVFKSMTRRGCRCCYSAASNGLEAYYSDEWETVSEGSENEGLEGEDPESGDLESEDPKSEDQEDE